MKKIFTVLLVMVSVIATAQGETYSDGSNLPKWVYPHLFSLGIGYTNTSVDTMSSSSGGVNFGFSIYNLYMSFSNNGEKGKGEFLDYDSGMNYTTDKSRVWQYNFGWHINAYKQKLIITPKIGYIDVDDVVNDYGGYDTYFYADRCNHISFGVNVAYYFNKYVGVMMGTATKQPIDIQVVFRL